MAEEKKIEPIILKDYLATLVNSISKARVEADIKSVMIAKEYSEDKYMKHLSIPRMKIKDVQLDIPIAIHNFPKKSDGNIDNQDLMSKVYSDVKNYFMIDAIPEDTSYLIRKEIFSHIDKLEKGNLHSIKSEDKEKNIDSFSKKISNKVLELVVKSKDKKIILKSISEKDPSINISRSQKSKINKLEKDFNTFLKNQLLEYSRKLRKKTKLENIEVIAQPHILKELPENSLVRIKANIIEESLEWSYEDDDGGNIKKRLLPE